MQQVIENLESGLDCRNAINDNFTELYGAAQLPIKLSNVSANTTQTFAANSFLLSVSMYPVSGSPAINIGTTPNGGEITDGTVSGFFFIQAGLYMLLATTLYITFTGTGSVNIRFDYQSNYF